MIAAIAMCVFAMETSGQFRAGGFLNFNVAGISVKPDISSEEYSRFLGIGLGGVANYTLAGNLELQAEPMFIQKGGKITEGGRTLKLKILYLELPVFIRYSIPVSDLIIPYVILGPNIGVRPSVKVVYPDGSSYNADDEISVLDLGLGFGGGAEYKLGDLILFGEVKYVLGINDINKEANESKVRNRSLQFLFGVKVPLELAGNQ